MGDTLRVSLTADPVEEVDAGWHLLRALELREGGITLTSCPTCARCDVNLDPIVHAVKARLRPLDHRLRAEGRSLRVAVMGCEVNGPGEARDADIGIAGAIGEGLLFRMGQSLGRVSEADLIDTFVREVETLAARG
ncbi:MAG: 4-hydroxy-3-methylbut-2-en-1-yl diphosphate synthase [bacterium ADurb.Bin429]|nr:MAG: 4-hydroxy-3-methylbut-2-en-1-yl diphosphate synthase [bacterium ADurb.Bin429]